MRTLIAKLPRDSRERVKAVAEKLRDTVASDDGQEAELALTLVLAELMARSGKH